MVANIRAARAALLISGILSAAVVSAPAGAQRSTPRPSEGHLSRPSGPERGGRRDDGDWDRHSGSRRRIYGGGSTAVIYLPADEESLVQQSGAYFPEGVYVAPGMYVTQGVVVGQGGYITRSGAGAVYDATGRPVTPSYSTAPGGGGGYTPDLTGTPYVVGRDGVMLLDMPTGAQRSVPSCAAERAARDPSGKPRTIFYQPTDYGLVLREGQRGRIPGTPAADEATCYGIDQFGRVALLGDR